MAIDWNFRNVWAFVVFFVGQLPSAVKAEIPEESLHRVATASSSKVHLSFKPEVIVSFILDVLDRDPDILDFQTAPSNLIVRKQQRFSVPLKLWAERKAGPP